MSNWKTMKIRRRDPVIDPLLVRIPFILPPVVTVLMRRLRSF